MYVKQSEGRKNRFQTKQNGSIHYSQCFYLLVCKQIIFFLPPTDDLTTSGLKHLIKLQSAIAQLKEDFTDSSICGDTSGQSPATFSLSNFLQAAGKSSTNVFIHI